MGDTGSASGGMASGLFARARGKAPASIEHFAQSRVAKCAVCLDVLGTFGKRKKYVQLGVRGVVIYSPSTTNALRWSHPNPNTPGSRTVEGVGQLPCSHVFCMSCITEWARVNRQCPLCKEPFANIQVQTRVGGPVVRQLAFEAAPASQSDDSTASDADELACTVCGLSTHEEALLLCDGCDAGIHLWCLIPPLRSVPEGDWYCRACTVEPPLKRSCPSRCDRFVSERASSDGEDDAEYQPDHDIDGTLGNHSSPSSSDNSDYESDCTTSDDITSSNSSDGHSNCKTTGDIASSRMGQASESGSDDAPVIARKRQQPDPEEEEQKP